LDRGVGARIPATSPRKAQALMTNVADWSRSRNEIQSPPRYKTKYRVSNRADSSSDYKSDDEGCINAHIREIVAADPETEWFHDLSRAYDGDEYIFIDDSHVSENGNALMAERVAEIAWE
jgi:hypothetical protein